MDPEATIARWRNATEQGEEKEAYEAAHDLIVWIERGGFMPKLKDSAEFRAIRADAFRWTP